MSYRVEKIEGCVVVYGSLPVNVMVSVLKNAGKDAVMDNQIKNILGATIVAGTVENLKRLKQVVLKPEIPFQFRAGIGEGACKWIEEGDVGLSSNFILFTFTGFNALAWYKNGITSDAPVLAYPRDVDDLSRCLKLLEAQPDFKERLDEMSKTSPIWASLVEQWDAIFESMEAEAPNWRNPLAPYKAPRTYDLIKKSTTIDDT